MREFLEANASVKERMKEALAAIQDGSFAKDWIEENENGQPRFNDLRKAGYERNPLEDGTGPPVPGPHIPPHD